MSQQHSGTSQTTTSKYKQPKIRAQSHKTVIDPLKRDSHWGKKKALLESVVSSFCVENILAFSSCLPQKK